MHGDCQRNKLCLNIHTLVDNKFNLNYEKKKTNQAKSNK